MRIAGHGARAAIVALVLLLVVAVRGQGPDQDVQLRSEVVVVPLSIQFGNGRPGAPLTETDFALTDGGVTPEIAFFQRDVAPLDVALLVDTSGSTGATLPVLERAAADFVGHLGKGDAYTLFTFADRPNVVVPWTGDGAAVRDSLVGAKSSGYTLLNMSAFVAIGAAFGGRPPERRRALVLLTDGIDTGSGFYTLQKVADAALARDVTVFVVSVNRLASEAIDTMIAKRLVPETTWDEYRDMQAELREVEPRLGELAVRTGGRVLFPTKSGDLSDAYEQIGEELRSRYVIGFYVPDGAAPGFHPITVTARRPGVTVRARAGYFHDVAPPRATP
jgi:Ca-activated chloride channel family protein